jgi:hypothetical protein
MPPLPDHERHAKYRDVGTMHEVKTAVEINASCAEVWRALTDLGAYHLWNPTIPWISGRAEEGRTLRMVFRSPGALPVYFHARVSVVTPNREFRWTGKVITPPLFVGDHYFVLEPMGANRVNLVQGETFAGAIAPVMFRLLRDYNRSGFRAWTAALMVYLEARPPVAADRMSDR